MVTLSLFTAILLTFQPVLVRCGDYIPEKTCAVLYSSVNFGGESFSLEDFDMSVNLERDYRFTLTGWQNTSSARVTKGCQLTLCDDKYFQGKCQTFSSDQAALGKEKTDVESVNCTCTRVCNCDDIVVPRNYLEDGNIVRAYVNGSCNTCNAEFIWLYKGTDKIPADESTLLTAFAVPKECNITLCPGPICSGFLYSGLDPVFIWRYGKVSSYRLSCDDNTSQPTATNSSYPEIVNLPQGVDALKKMMTSNKALSNHPGIKAALQSAQNNRSSNSVFILILGHHKPYSQGFPHCKTGPTKKIAECHIPQRLDHLGIVVEVIIISVGIGMDTEDNDYVIMATLDQYLSTHEQLKKVIPNVVIFIHDIDDNEFDTIGSRFNKKFHWLHANRTKLLDEKHLNVVFLFYHLEDLPVEDQTQPAKYIDRFEKVFEEWTIPKPFIYCTRSKALVNSRFVNGHLRMENGDYFPKNLEDKLINAFEKGGDLLGKAALKSYFRDNVTPHYSIEPKVVDAKPPDSLVKKYKGLIYKPPGSTADNSTGSHKGRRKDKNKTKLKGRALEAPDKEDDEEDDYAHAACVGNAAELERKIDDLRMRVHIAKWSRLNAGEKVVERYCTARGLDCSKIKVREILSAD